LNMRLREYGSGGGGEECQWALTRNRSLGAPERGHGADLEPLAQLGDAHGGVGTLDITILILVETTELVASQAAKGRRSVNGR